MFGKKVSNPSNVDPDLYKFLREADAAYIRAFETRTPGVLMKLFTPDCCMRLSQWIVAEASLRYFGNEKSRTTTWTEVSSEVDTKVILKECKYKDVKLSLSKSIRVSDDYSEYWTVHVSQTRFIVQDVQDATYTS